MKKLTFQVKNQKGRIDKVIAENFTDYSRSQVQHWLKEELVTANGKIVKANYKVANMDEIEITLPTPEVLDIQAENIPLEIVYEDEDVAVINKPQGMVVHPATSHTSGTLVNALMYHIKDLSTINDVVRPGIVHRIDKDTSGLLMIAKNDKAHESLAEQLKNHTSERKYIALVHGVIPHEKGTIEAPIARHKTDRKKQAVIEGGKPAITHFTVLERFGEYTLVELKLETGRTHQIRVHMNYIGHAVAGDPIYAPRKTLKGHGQFLHAKILGFTHPTTGERMTFEVDEPQIFKETLESLRKMQ
ncbi:23S rRNA pseudouridine1911/1915/1917 synthase [Pilibacter termitis]|uniref:Pseudouridine synthase n=1 Tax=Pilibacter termitis TaxID=263852 RepID=A0A1T4K7T6_9ENTE|nr:RluA family pseudouridine synthase [Pilibacter termitis]SJZ38407.1 23S rRNA pseudouridine1911/1915/1917 synthase [Pilibacter termitis]